MKKKIYFLALSLVALFVIGCDSNSVTPIQPSDISNVRYEARPGAIFLQWDVPADRNFEYIRITYFDHLTGRNALRLASSYGDTILIPNTRARFGAYVFTLQTVSSTGTWSANTREITAVSGPAPVTTVIGPLEQVPLTAAQLSTDMQEPSEGPLANLLTDDATQFFHSRWGSPVPPAPHWFQVDLGQVVDTDNYIRFWYRRRTQNNNNRPTNFDLMGSLDGNTWFLVRNFTQANDGLPTASEVNEWFSPNVFVPQPFRYIRFSVNATNNNTVFFTMSGFRFYVGILTVYDPENPN